MIMKELSLHVMDIVQNSISAGARLVTVTINASTAHDMLTISVRDDGKGMDEAMTEAVQSPFTTSRTTRKVGLGIPFFKEGAIACDGGFKLESKVGKGTFIEASYKLSHIDRPPLGNIGETVYTLVLCNPDVDFILDYERDDKSFIFDTRELRSALGGVPFDVPEVSAWIKDYIYEGIEDINGGI